MNLADVKRTKQVYETEALISRSSFVHSNFFFETKARNIETSLREILKRV